MSVATFISVVVPFHNRRDQVTRCIAALKAQVLPSGMDFEIVAVDNNSTDGTGEAIAGGRVRIVRCDKPGPAAARNVGIAAASSEIVAMIDSDCVPAPVWLRNLVEPFEDPDVIAVGGRVLAWSVTCGVAFFAEFFGVLNQRKYFDGNVLGFPPFLVTANVAYRKNALLRIGGFDESLRIGEDSDISWRLLELGGKFAYSPDAVVRHAHRETFRGMFDQARDYGIGAAAVFAKHRDKMKRRVAVQWAEYTVLAAMPLLIPWKLLTGFGSFERKFPLYEAIWRTGFTIGRLQGSMRYKVLFL